jgi:hypothetical protein
LVFPIWQNRNKSRTAPNRGTSTENGNAVLPKTALIGKCAKKEKRVKKNVTREVILIFVQFEQHTRLTLSTEAERSKSANPRQRQDLVTCKSKNKRTEALKAGRSTERERSRWDAARMPVGHSAENTRTTRTTTGDRKTPWSRHIPNGKIKNISKKKPGADKTYHKA